MRPTRAERSLPDAGSGSISIPDLAKNLVRDDAGIWTARSATDVSYPEEGNAWCREIEDSSFWFQHRNRCILALMERYPPAGAVFDIGGGNGFVAAAIQLAGRQVVLVEPGPSGAANARVRGIEQVICATLDGAGFHEHVLPAAGLFDVLEHIEDDRGFLRRLHKVLIPGGRVYLTVPAYRLLWSVEDDHARHFRRYTVGQVSAALRQAGFAIDFASYIFAILPVPILLTRGLPSRLGLRRKVSLSTERREHDPGSGAARALLEWSLRRELHVLREGGRIRFGGSCLVVATAA